MIFNINFSEWKELLLPPRLRGKLRFGNLLDALLSGVNVMHLDLLHFRSDILFKLRHNGQVIYLEHALNAKFNNGLPAYSSYPNLPTGIYIAEGSNINQYYRFRMDEETPNDNGHLVVRSDEAVRWTAAELNDPLHPERTIYRYNQSEMNTALDFIVMIPNAVGNVSNPAFSRSVRAWVDYYRQAGSQFTLQNY